MSAYYQLGWYNIKITNYGSANLYLPDDDTATGLERLQENTY